MSDRTSKTPNDCTGCTRPLGHAFVIDSAPYCNECYRAIRTYRLAKRQDERDAVQAARERLRAKKQAEKAPQTP